MGVCKVFGGCLEGVHSVSGRYLWDIQMVRCVSICIWRAHQDWSTQDRSSEDRSSQDRSSEDRLSGQVQLLQVKLGQVKLGQVWSGQVKSGQVKSGHVKYGQSSRDRSNLKSWQVKYGRCSEHVWKVYVAVFSQRQHFLLQDVFFPIFDPSVWVLLHYFYKHFWSFLEIQVLRPQEFKDPKSYVNLNPHNSRS